ncbi:MAG TPA: triose-phosphate isomerase [Gemmatimonadales bacterium]|nr:triose-phosphate isomerase [Gemmatimonadales bacterium]
MRGLLFAANWKMNLGPSDASAYMASFLPAFDPRPDRMVWFFPPALSVNSVVAAVRDSGRHDIVVGVQDIYWEPKGAFTGAISGPLAAQAGARAVLIGHSERRHVFGETDEQTGKKLAAAIAAELHPVLCVGETLEQRDAGQTLAVATRQLNAALAGRAATARVTIAYEPVWAIGTGRNATPRDAATVHAAIRAWLEQQGAAETQILYGGSVNLKNAAELLAEPELDGVLVGGASLDPQAWGELVRTAVA